MRIKKGDTVEVINGNDRGKRSEVIRVLPQEERVVVRGVNIHKKHQRQQQTAGQRPLGSGVVQFEAPLHASRVMLVCPKCDEAVRVGYQRDAETGKAVRICRKCGALFES
ncbi:MAG: 50S ribosomal protein L24 [Chloroflexi bacterium]|nr:50S ribosomal protein L24 [Chloroflexota bacterium]